MRITADEYKALLEGRKKPEKKNTGNSQGKTENITIILPFKLPTWNQLFAMGHWQRAKVRTWIKERVSECIASGAEWRTPTGLVRKLSLTDLSLLEYSEMIIPNSSQKLRLAKKLAKSRKQ